MYTDGSASKRRGLWKAGCGVWFSDDSPHNISTQPRGKQTVNRAELSAVLLAMRKALRLCDGKKITIFSDSRYCIDGINVSMWKWVQDGWTRRGKLLRNGDIWRIVHKALVSVKESGITIVFKHVPAHVGIYGNERVDRLAKAAMERAHKAVPRRTSHG